MMRILHLIGLVASVGLVVATIYYANEVADARFDSYMQMYSDYSYDDPYSSYSYDSYDRDNEITEEAGVTTIIFFVFFLALYVLSLMKIKTTTVKVFSIIVMSITAIMIAWALMMVSSPGGISFDEVGIAWLAYAALVLASGIVGTVHAFKKAA